MMTINYGGKQYKSLQEFKDAMKSDPNCDTLFWENQNIAMVANGKVHTMTGKCTYRGKVYEGKVEYIGNKLYVGGVFVKNV